MKSAVLISLLFFSCMYLSTAQGSYSNCCLSHVRSMRKNAKLRIQSFTLQETDGDCNIPAVIFVLKKREKEAKQRKVCANPNDRWVQDLFKVLHRKLNH